MRTDKTNTRENDEHQKPSHKERIDLNHADSSTEEDKAIKQHSDQDLQDIDRNLNEQMGGTDNTVTSEPNHI